MVISSRLLHCPVMHCTDLYLYLTVLELSPYIGPCLVWFRNCPYNGVWHCWPCLHEHCKLSYTKYSMDTAYYWTMHSIGHCTLYSVQHRQCTLLDTAHYTEYIMDTIQYWTLHTILNTLWTLHTIGHFTLY